MNAQFIREFFLNITPERHRAATEAAREIVSRARAEADAIIAASNGKLVPLFPSFIDYPTREFFESMPCEPIDEP